jgi:hypothetical protein
VTPTADDFAALEARIGAILPGLLRVTLARRNGFYVPFRGEEWTVFPVQVTGDLGSSHRTFDDIGRQTASAREFHRLPEDLIVIGAIPDVGRWAALRPEGGRLGLTVYEWERGLDEPVVLADHLSDFIEGDE